jgi:predicted  nucleic acid-binding Zn-ribbon protein
LRDVVRALVKLGEIDDAASGIDKELKDLPNEIEEMRGDVARLDGLLAAERRELVEAEDLLASYGEQVAQSNEALSRAKQKGAKSKNAREVEAAEREMEIIRRTIKDREEEQLKLVEAIDQKKASLATREEKLVEFRKMFEDEEAKAKVRTEELLGERAKVTAGRSEIEAKLDKQLLRRYERIRQGRGSAVAVVIDATCTGCRLQLPPQTYNELHRCQDLFQCPQCQRFIYLKQTIED